jgi:hypothetical protein
MLFAWIMRRLRDVACAWILAAGCVGTEAGYVRVASPELVAISPTVQVVSDADEPLFYAWGYYWLYRDRVWLRSDSYGGRFAPIDVEVVPGELRAIPQPQAYAHYRRHAAYAQRTSPVRPQPIQQPRQPPEQPIQPIPPQVPMPLPPAPGHTPTEPEPSAPTQKPPVPHPMPSQTEDTPQTR